MATEKISRIASDFQTQLSGAISIGATSFVLQSVTDADGNNLSDGIYAFTVDRDNTSRKEYFIGQLDYTTKTVSSISSVSAQGVLTANAQKAHRIGANVVISDHSILVALSRIFNGTGTIDPASPLAYTTAPTLSSAAQIATKGYVDSVVSGGTVNTDRIIVGSQTAGETVAAGNIVYFKSSDSRWWLADADLTATFSNVQLGVALGSGTAGNAIVGGVQIYGKCDSFTGLTATATYYLSNTAGAVSTSAGTTSIVLGQAFSTTGIFFNPDTSTSGAINTTTGASDANKLIKTNASGLVDATFTVVPITRTYNLADSPATWTKLAGLKYIEVQAWGGGGSGGCTNGDGTSTGTGGGGGAYNSKTIQASSLGATETITIGAGGASKTSGDGDVGGTSSFGSHLLAYGGGSGTALSSSAALFGGGGGGQGSAGGSGSSNGLGGIPGTPHSGDSSNTVAAGNGFYGGGGGGGTTSSAGLAGGKSAYGGGGGGGSVTGNASSGGTSVYGGNGGNAGDTNSAGVAGSVPGGGGGGRSGINSYSSGAGGAGRVIVTEYYN
jgi:hypothetical protein